MKQRIQELALMTVVCLVLYYLYWSFADESLIDLVFTDFDGFLVKTGIDVLVCLLLTCFSIIYSRVMMRLITGYTLLQRWIIVPTLILFILDMLTAWGLSELCQRLFGESNFVDYFLDIFIFGILATLVSSVKMNSLFWQKKMEIEHERSVLENKVVEAERVMANARLHNLQLQVNPHFFFNNLSALSALITTDAKAAKEFVAALALMYRHILNGMKKELIPLAEEMQLVREYAKLLSIRHGKSVRINLPDDRQIPQQAYVPPISVQHLVENAVKHNAMTAASPLTVTITINNGRVSVCNNRSPLFSTEPHSGTGLSNLQEQLKLFGVANLEKSDNDKYYCISFPFIQQK